MPCVNSGEGRDQVGRKSSGRARGSFLASLAHRKTSVPAGETQARLPNTQRNWQRLQESAVEVALRHLG